MDLLNELLDERIVFFLCFGGSGFSYHQIYDYFCYLLCYFYYWMSPDAGACWDFLQVRRSQGGSGVLFPTDFGFIISKTFSIKIPCIVLIVPTSFSDHPPALSLVFSEKNASSNLGAIHKRRQNILEGGGTQIPMLQDIRR